MSLGDAETGPAKAMNIMSDEELLKIQLEEMRREHRELDVQIADLQEAGARDALTMSRLKKRKLMLKDRIARLQDQLYPDIIA